MRIPKAPIIAVSLSFALVAPAWAGDAKKKAPSPDTVPKGPEAFDERVKKGIDKGLRWLRGQQFDDGSYGHYPALTAMAALSFLKSHRGYTEADGPFLGRAIEYLLAQQKPDGGIYQRDLPTYNTAMALLALGATKNPKHKPAIEKAQKFLVSKQSTEENGYKKTDKYYGGIGYGGDERPDLSNLQLALEALKQSGFPADHDVFEKAKVFIDRCQNRSESNDQEWAGDDGGFIYAPGDSPFGGTKSYGAMSYAGLKSLIYANVGKDDPRVKAAVDWARANYTVDEHPGAGQVSLYYYYYTFAKALSTFGADKLTDARGVERDWHRDLSEKLLGLQKEDGSWANPEPKYWEGNPLVATSWALLAMSAGLD